MWFYKIYYSIVYLSYKSLRYPVKKDGNHMYKSYITNAIRLIGVTFTLTILICLLLINIKDFRKDSIFLTALASGGVLMLLLNVTLTRKKLFKYRFIFTKSNSYAYLYAAFLFACIFVSFSIFILSDK